MKKINILNLKCNGCANTIKKGLLVIEGVNHVDVALEDSEITINDVSEEVFKTVKEKLSKMGYPEVGDANTMIHKAKSFVSCATGKLDN
ncbi:MAG TPA: heavy-metal-associated domain-containing protein [Flavobacteriia bacterium]|nr:heavy-metal-associated domain-containing protein [Flavobacteriia bacterium]